MSVKRSNKAVKEAGILLVAVVVMTLKIMIGVILFHRWRQRQEALGRPVSLDDELE